MPQSKSRKIAILGYRSVDDCVPSVENASSWHSGVLHWHLFQNHPWNRNSQCLWTQGKSSLTIQFVEGQFVDSYDPTIENTFTKLITVNGQEYHLQLVDTAGQDEYSIFPQTYSIDINGYILVYSVTSIKSFEVIKVIHGKLLDMVGKVQIPIMLVGNKKDLHMERLLLMFSEG
ncbi:GTP-binding protein Rheb isoform X4 [Myotis myotis]|uniref:GTP-binding protein Rheb isoform X4 n=1 Tax=Myotis myotis TaxID=51298 RepID=UPI0017484AD6|nr:GTP-binding protein Rheb isoform X4 [Myotis myotis]